MIVVPIFDPNNKPIALFSFIMFVETNVMTNAVKALEDAKIIVNIIPSINDIW